MAYGLQTFNDKSIREDLLDIISDVSPDENPLSTMLKTSTATQNTHEWLEDYISRPTSNTGTVEGSDATFADLTQPSRRGNVIQTIRETFKVSDQQIAAQHAGMADPFEYQKKKALVTWKNRQEFALLRSSLGSGASGTASTMIGIEAVITSHYTARLSGTSLSETEFNAMVYDVANDVGTEYIPDMVLTTLQLRQKLSTFTAGSTRYVDASDKKLVRKVMVYESDFGVHRIFGHKDVYSSNATPGPRVDLLKEDTWKIAYLRKPKFKALPENGSYKAGMIEGDMTLEYLAERANASRSGFNQAG